MHRKLRLSLMIVLLVLPLFAGMGPLARAQGDPDGSTAYTLNMRGGPGSDYAILAALEPGTGLVFEARSADTAWLLGRTVDGAYRGWVAGLYLTYRDGFTAARLPFSDEIIAGSAAPAETAPAASAPDAAAPVPAGGSVAGTVTQRLNVRRGPSTDHPILTRIDAHTPVTVAGRSAAADWVLIRSADGAIEGWVAAQYVALSSGASVNTLPVSEAEITNVPEPSEIIALRGTPVIASATGTAHTIYQRGLARGNRPDRFSKVGDCQSVPGVFLGPFDRGEYSLGAEYAHLQTTIDQFAGSFNRDSAAVWSGFNAYAVLDPTFANPSRCAAGESPIACEYRIWKPSFVIISLEVWRGTTSQYIDNLRQILDFWIGVDVVPILATKPDNREDDWSINSALYNLAREYDIPLWNFFMAAQPLPGFGLTDGFHLSYAQNNFDDPRAMQNAWPWRNLTALQSLDAVWRGVGGG